MPLKKLHSQMYDTVLGRTKSGRDVYGLSYHPDHSGFTHDDHAEATKLHDDAARKVRLDWLRVKTQITGAQRGGSSMARLRGIERQYDLHVQQSSIHNEAGRRMRVSRHTDEAFKMPDWNEISNDVIGRRFLFAHQRKGLGRDPTVRDLRTEGHHTVPIGSGKIGVAMSDSAELARRVDTNLRTMYEKDAGGIRDILPYEHVARKAESELAMFRSEDLIKSEAEFLQMYKPDHQGYSGAKDFVTWARKTLPNTNWQTWAVRNHRDNPQAFDDATKTKLRHYASMGHVPTIGKMRFDKTHDLPTAFKMLGDAEKSYVSEQKEKLNVVTPGKAKRIVDAGTDAHGNQMAWFDLQKPSCSAEGRAMGHCGNVGGAEEGESIYSLRTIHKLGGKTYHQPHLTFINTPGEPGKPGRFGQMKGRGNDKPAAHYHNAIKQLLLQTGATPAGGGYMEENNFHLDDFGDDDAKEVVAKHPHMALYSRHATPENITQALQDQGKSVRRVAIQHPNATPEQITQGLKDQDSYVRLWAIQHPNATPEHITQALQDQDADVRYRAIGHPNATPEHITQALQDQDADVRYRAIKHPNATPEQITQGLKDQDSYVRLWAIQHPNATPEHITQALQDQDEFVRGQAILHPNATPEQITQGLQDQDEFVRDRAIRNPNATPENITQALQDQDADVRYRAIGHPNATPEHITQALQDQDADVRYRAIKHPNATPEHITQGLKDQDSYVRLWAVRNPNATPEHITQALKDQDADVREIAKERLEAMRQQGALGKAEDWAGGTLVPIVSVAVFNSHGQLLMGKRNDSGLWTLPGGHVDSGENAEAAAHRELKEETGFDIGTLVPIGAHEVTSESGSRILVMCYRAFSDAVDNPKVDPDHEVSQWEWVDVDGGLPDHILNNLHAEKNVTLHLLGLQSWDQDLSKTQPLFLFPQLGAARQHYNIDYRDPKYTNQARERLGEKGAAKEPPGQYRGIVTGRHYIRSGVPYGLRVTTGGVDSAAGGNLSTRLHENQHAVFSDIAEQHGRAVSSKLARHLINSIPEQFRSVFDKVVNMAPSVTNAHPMYRDEERLTFLHNYLNSPERRAEVNQYWERREPGNARKMDQIFKKVHRHLRRASHNASFRDLESVKLDPEVEWLFTRYASRDGSLGKGDVLQVLTTELANPGPEVLVKSLKHALVAGATILASMTPQSAGVDRGTPIKSPPAVAAQVQPAKPEAVVQPDAALDRFLHAIAQAESSGGQFTDHPVMTKGIHKGFSAIGPHGIMPFTAKTIARRATNPDVKSLANMGVHDIVNTLESNPDLTQAVARSHAKQLSRRFGGDKQKMAYAWFNGPNAVGRRTPDQISNHWYTQRVMNAMPQVSKSEDPIKSPVGAVQDSPDLDPEVNEMFDQIWPVRQNAVLEAARFLSGAQEPVADHEVQEARHHCESEESVALHVYGLPSTDDVRAALQALAQIIEDPKGEEQLDKAEKPFVKRDLDPAEGITISHEHFHHHPDHPTIKHHLVVSAHDKSGTKVGESHIDNSGRKYMSATAVNVSAEHRRKGIATAMYRHAENVTGKKMHPSGDRTSDGTAFWRGTRGQGTSGHGPFGLHVRRIRKAERPPSEPDRSISRLIAVPNKGEHEVMAVNRGIAAGKVTPIAKPGKFSKNAFVVFDPQSNDRYIIKPDPHKAAPTKGIDNSVPPPVRERVFWDIAQALGLSSFLPATALAIDSGHEVYSITQYLIKYRSIDSVKRELPGGERGILETYRKHGLIHRWAVLDFVGGNTDRHGNNILISEDYTDIKFIDHGSSLADSDFSPGADPKSFLPFYLRAFGARARMDSQQKLSRMPTVDHEIDAELTNWVLSIDAAKIHEAVSTLPEPIVEAVMARLGVLRSSILKNADNRRACEIINSLWLGLN